jgi:hypothetical protein
MYPKNLKGHGSGSYVVTYIGSGEGGGAGCVIETFYFVRLCVCQNSRKIFKFLKDILKELQSRVTILADEVL